MSGKYKILFRLSKCDLSVVDVFCDDLQKKMVSAGYNFFLSDLIVNRKK